MKKSLAHLPKHKRDELKLVKEIILDECPTVLMITKGQLEYLAQRVQKLQELTKKICEARIEAYLSA
jgi:hypothetical protein